MVRRERLDLYGRFLLQLGAVVLSETQKNKRHNGIRTGDGGRLSCSSPSLLDGLLQQLLQRELLLVMLSHQFVHLRAVRFLHGVVLLQGKHAFIISSRWKTSEHVSGDQHGPWRVVSLACSVPSAASSSV